jgi:hypothetical protein
LGKLLNVEACKDCVILHGAKKSKRTVPVEKSELDDRSRPDNTNQSEKKQCFLALKGADSVLL